MLMNPQQSIQLHAGLPGSEDSFSKEELLRQSALFSDIFLTRHLLDNMPGMILVLNRSRQIVFANMTFKQMTAWPEDQDLIGMRVGDVLGCHVAQEVESGCESGNACDSCGALAAMLEGSGGKDAVRECTLTQQDGSELQNLTLRIWSSSLHYNGQEFIVLAGMDISHERRRLALENIFFHDIINLVGSIHGFAELMEVDQSINPLEVSRLIRHASQRVIDEIDAQRILLAVEKGDWSMSASILESRNVLDSVAELYAVQDVARGRLLKIEDDTASVHFESDVTLLRRILGNMVKNALEATPSGEAVTLGADVIGKDLCFWVHNPAVIPISYRQRIFQRDFSTKGSGRGLGTYSMKLLSKFLDGDVNYESSQEIGTRFVLKLPVEPRPAQ